MLIADKIETHIRDRRGRWSSDIRAELEKRYPEGKEDVKKRQSVNLWDEDVEKICKTAFHSKKREVTDNDIRFAKQVASK